MADELAKVAVISTHTLDSDWCRVCFLDGTDKEKR
jgi:hypothetical protein